MHASRDFVRAHPDFVRQGALGGMVLRQKFVQWRVEQTNRGRSSIERFENADEIPLLIWQQFRQRFLPIVRFARQNHFAHGVDAITLEKHVLGPAKTNAASAERNGIFYLLWRISVSPNSHAGDF